MGILGDSSFVNSADFNSVESANSLFRADFLGALNDDMNISVALSAVDSMISSINEALDKNPKDRDLAANGAANLAYIAQILGVGLKDPIDYFHLGVDVETKAHIEVQIALRNEARAAKDFALADKIRDELKSRGISLLDTKNGVIWEFLG